MIVELYKFRIGAESWLYTSAQQPITYQGEEYQPSYVKRGAVRGTGAVARSAIKVHVPRDADFATRFAGAPPTEVAQIEIYQQDDTATAVVYIGRVLTVARQGSEAVCNCESVFTSMRQAGLRRHYQKQCPFALYDHNCRVPRANFRVDATLTAVSATQWQATEFDAKPDGWFTGGDVEWGSLPERRSIVAHSGDTITLDSAMPDAAAGDPVAAFAGCAHDFATCRDKFANELNYGGMPAIPSQNPFGTDPVF